jgi:hypothetical protein
MKLLDDYNTKLQEIYNYFGFREDWAVFPLDDARRYFWEMSDDEVTFYDTREAYETQDMAHAYSNEICNHRHYPKAVYEGADFTLIMVDTHTDGNKFLQIFDNSKRVK